MLAATLLPPVPIHGAAASGMLRRAVVALAAIGAVSGLAPRLCARDVRDFLYTAIQGGAAVSAARSLSTAACYLNSRTGFTPLHEVASRGGIRGNAIVGILIDAYASVMETDVRGATALHVAAERNGVSAALGLVNAARESGHLGTLLALYEDSGLTALDLADDAGQVAIARFLLMLGAPRAEKTFNISAGIVPDAWECAEPLVDAVLLGDSARLSTLLQTKSQATQQQVSAGPGDCLSLPAAQERSLLHIAVAVTELTGPPGGLDVVELLLDYGANASQPNGLGETPLAGAARGNRQDVVDVLLRRMPDTGVDLQDKRGRTALHEASRVGARNAASALLAGGASVDLKDASGFTAMDYAQREGHDEVVSAIDLAVRMPRAKEATVSSQAPIIQIGGPTVADEPSEDEKGNIALIGGVIGVVLGTALCMLVAFAVRQYCYSPSKAIVAALPKLSAADTPPRKTPKRPNAISEPTLSALAPPGQVGSDSDGGARSPGSTPGSTPKASKLHRVKTDGSTSGNNAIAPTVLRVVPKQATNAEPLSDRNVAPSPQSASLAVAAVPQDPEPFPPQAPPPPQRRHPQQARQKAARDCSPAEQATLRRAAEPERTLPERQLRHVQAHDQALKDAPTFQLAHPEVTARKPSPAVMPRSPAKRAGDGPTLGERLRRFEEKSHGDGDSPGAAMASALAAANLANTGHPPAAIASEAKPPPRTPGSSQPSSSRTTSRSQRSPTSQRSGGQKKTGRTSSSLM